MERALKRLSEAGASINYHNNSIYIFIPPNSICCAEFAEIIEEIINEGYQLRRFKNSSRGIYLTFDPV